jgi:hypothetical protein
MSLQYIVRLIKQTSLKIDFLTIFKRLQKMIAILISILIKIKSLKVKVGLIATKLKTITFTRVSDNSSSIIDHIYVNKCENISNYSVLQCAVSDHQTIFC